MNLIVYARLRPPPGRWQSLGLVHWSVQWIEAGSVVSATIPALCLFYVWKIMKIRTLAGIAITVLWFMAVAILVYLSGKPIGDMELNAIGDFLAGVFSPVAFMWLVIGYFQQGEELRLQAAELSKQVAEQKELSNATKRHVDLIEGQLKDTQRRESNQLKIRLRFIATEGINHSDHSSVIQLRFQNYGNSGADFDFSTECGHIEIMSAPVSIRSGDQAFLKLHITAPNEFQAAINFIYTDSVGDRRKGSIQLSGTRLLIEIVTPD